ncbi:family 16 glycoside hydrolase [Petrimonas sp.]|uniref:family 16 glycoside hydrolase n=1 Tax=Petrimonas sp. TaxID=2023866 RepID=UPI002FC7F840
MKKYLSILTAILLATGALMAQLPQGRTSATIIADALAQLPADNQTQYNRTMTDLVSTGEQGLLDLIGRMNPPGNRSNEALDYAISGWTNFVANDDAKRALAANAFGKALNQSLDNEVKAFVIRQLGQIGTDNNVETLSAFLKDSHLSAPAVQALASIGSEKANQAIVAALSGNAPDAVKFNIVNALTQTGYSQAEPALLSTLSQNPSAELSNALLTALGSLGSRNALIPLKNAAQKVNYSYQLNNNATASYLSLLKRLTHTDVKLVEKEANGLLNFAIKQNRSDLKVAAAGLLLAIPSTDKNKLLNSALKDGDIAYLARLLNAYPFNNDRKAVERIMKELSPKASAEKQTAIIYWLGDKKVANTANMLANFATSGNKMVQKAAISSLAKIGNEQAMLVLAGLLKSQDDETVLLAKDALSTYKGDISYTLASVFNESGDVGKKAILQLIANRKMESQYNLVYNQMFTGNENVKTEAANTLQYVSTDKNLPDLFTLLEQSDAANVPALQQAVNAALSYLPANEQMKLVSDRMNKSVNKHLYYTALANSGSQKAMEMITKAYNTETGANKNAAFDALTNWKSFNSIYPMLDIARNSKNKNELSKVTDEIVATINKSNETGAIKYLYLREVMQFAQTEKQKNDILRLLGNTGQYQAMLFVAPYMDNVALSENAALAAMNIATNNPAFAGVVTTGILQKVSKTLKNPDAGYQRESIKKYLDENPQDGGFVSIFNGKNLDGWKGLVENPIKRAKMTPKELAAAQVKADAAAKTGWVIENGELLFTGKGDNLCTNKQYGDFEMLVDWKLYPGPEPDAGIYLRGTPQVQIWDTARVNVGAQVGSGGLYNNQQNPSKPLKVADQKVGEWNTFRIKMIGERVSVWLNDELVTDNVVLENYWNRSQPIFPTEQIELQAHGSKVAYRDIFIKEIERPEPFQLPADEKKEGFRVLFDGTNLNEWTGNKKDYVVESGNIVLYPSQNFGGNLYTKEQFDNFIFRFEFMLTPGANNGLGIRAPLEGDAAYGGMELQILDNDAPVYKNLQIYQYHGSVYGVIPAKRGYLKPVGEWNYQEVIADGDRIKVILNGTTILDGNIREASKNGTIDKRDHPGLLNKTGHIGFLGHGSLVKFRNIRIKPLK